MATVARARILPAVRRGRLLFVYLVVVLGLFSTNLDLWLNATGGLPVNLVHLQVAAVGAFFFALMLGPDAEAACRRLLQILAGAAVPLLFFLAWLAGHVLYFGIAVLPPGGDLAAVLPFLQTMLLLLALCLPAAPGFAGAIRPAAALSWAGLAATILWDAYEPGTFSIVPGRAAGLAMNPNVAAFSLLALLALAVRFGRAGVLDLLLVAASAVVLFFTFSRGGLLLWAVFAAVYVLALARQGGAAGYGRGLLLMGGVLALALLAGSWLLQSTGILEQSTARGRFDELTLQGDALADDDSRPQLLAHYLDLVRQRPFLGYGTGYSFIEPLHAPHAQGPHNMFLRVWVDHGLWGLLSFLGLMISATQLCWVRRQMAGVAVMAMSWLYCLVNHNVIDEKAFLLAFGISLGLAALQPPPARGRP